MAKRGGVDVGRRSTVYIGIGDNWLEMPLVWPLQVNLHLHSAYGNMFT